MKLPARKAGLPGHAVASKMRVKEISFVLCPLTPSTRWGLRDTLRSRQKGQTEVTCPIAAGSNRQGGDVGTLYFAFRSWSKSHSLHLMAGGKLSEQQNHPHTRSGDAAVLAGYLGKGSAFEDAVADFSLAYADQNEHDYAALMDAIRTGRLEARMGE